MSEWQSISTVPKDGTPVLIYSAGNRVGHSIELDYWHLEAHGYPYEGWYLATSPTHWMPLPEKPDE